MGQEHAPHTIAGADAIEWFLENMAGVTSVEKAQVSSWLSLVDGLDRSHLFHCRRLALSC